MAGAAGWGTACELSDDHPLTQVGTDDCVLCHRADFERALEPLHVQQLPLSCADCHDQQSWAPAAGSDHDSVFVLRGAHRQAGCGDCHQSFESGETPSECIGCHLADYQGASQPPHDELPITCGDCHDETAFSPARFDHWWPLEGAHAATSCSSCHVGDPPVYAGTPSECIDCHRADYEGATNPSHEGFSTDCASCHQPTAWSGASVGPGLQHAWPLRGAHQAAACTGCHLGDPPVYAGTPTQCIDCHKSDRDVAQPPHAGLSTDCASCHSETSFTPSSFRHPWTLTGAHTRVQCTACHTGTTPDYAGASNQCVSCHRADYDRSPYPGHSGFSTDCTSCHTTTAWKPATGGGHPDSSFPITGRHNYACMDCHNAALGPNSGDNTDCVGCHEGEHSRSRMDAEHGDVSGYPSGSAPANFCLDCHPRG